MVRVELENLNWVCGTKRTRAWIKNRILEMLEERADELTLCVEDVHFEVGKCYLVMNSEPENLDELIRNLVDEVQDNDTFWELGEIVDRENYLRDKDDESPKRRYEQNEYWIDLCLKWGYDKPTVSDLTDGPIPISYVAARKLGKKYGLNDDLPNKKPKKPKPKAEATVMEVPLMKADDISSEDKDPDVTAILKAMGFDD